MRQYAKPGLYYEEFCEVFLFQKFLLELSDELFRQPQSRKALKISFEACINILCKIALDQIINAIYGNIHTFVECKYLFNKQG